MELNIKQAVEFTKVSRSTIYSKIANGALSKTSDGKLDTSELLRVFGSPKNDAGLRNNTLLDSKKDTDIEVEFLRDKVKILESSLADTKIREAEFKERELWLQGQVDNITIKLLDAPKPPKPNAWQTRLTIIAFVVISVVLGALGLFTLHTAHYF